MITNVWGSFFTNLESVFDGSKDGTVDCNYMGRTDLVVLVGAMELFKSVKWLPFFVHPFGFEIGSAINTYIGSLCRRVIIASGLKHLLVSITTMNVIITYGDAGLLWFMPLSFESLIRKLAMKLLKVNCVAYCCPKDFSGAVRLE
ncbi:hypothetical protein Tco_1267065, partial [Tanacetum coccineum]